MKIANILSAIMENKWDIKYTEILPATTEGAVDNTGKNFHY